METKENKITFTPGPWKETTTYAKKQARRIEIVPWANQQKIIAKIANADTNEECYANARLIAAAPDLLEACKTAIRHLECSDENRPEIVACCLRQLRAAIALAEKGV